MPNLTDDQIAELARAIEAKANQTIGKQNLPTVPARANQTEEETVEGLIQQIDTELRNRSKFRTHR